MNRTKKTRYSLITIINHHGNTIKGDTMKEYLLTIEFRYQDAPRYEDDSTHHTKTVTVGVYPTFDEACKAGNEIMELLESKFELHVFPSGEKAQKERFNKNGGPFGTPYTLISNLAYLKTPFAFYAQITTLHKESIEDALDVVLTATNRYKQHLLKEIV